MSGQNYDGYSVLSKLIEDRGTTKVFFVNGVLVGVNSGIGRFEEQKNAVSVAFNLNSGLVSSMQMDGENNPTGFPSAEDIIAAMIKGLFAKLVLSAFTGGTTIPALTLQTVLSGVAEVVKGVAEDVGETIQQIYSDDSSLSSSVNSKWTDKVKNSLQNSNNSVSNNSVMFVGHSQGNLFIEDGLRDINAAPAQTRLIALGSPTDYETAGGIADIVPDHSGSGSQKYRGANIKNSDDPVTYFQAHSDLGEAALKDKAVTDLLSNIFSGVVFGVPGILLEKIFDFVAGGSLIDAVVAPLVPLIRNQFPKEYQLLAGIGGVVNNPQKAFSSTDGHGLGSKDDPESYLGQTTTKDSFKKLAYELQTDGYYFPNAKITGSGNLKGTQDDDDWIEGDDKTNRLEGLGRNDVLWGKDGDDILIGGRGYDFLDGGTDFDVADYSTDSIANIGTNAGETINPIRVTADTIAGSAIYRVQDGYENEDILVNVEKVIGTNSLKPYYVLPGALPYSDFMMGGGGRDIFFGIGGRDYLRGNGGQDSLNGGSEDDLLESGGGIEDEGDLLIGGAGRDIIRGGAGKDIIFGDFQDQLTTDPTDIVLSNSIPTSSPSISSAIPASSPSANSFRTTAFSAMSFSAPAPLPQLYADEIYGGANDDIIYAGLDDDFVSGESGNDEIYGESGNDVLFGDSGSDLIAGGIGNDIISGGSEDDELWGEDGEDTIAGDAGNDLIYGGEDNDIISGGLDNDRIYGEGGSDRISGDEGNDFLFGQDGNDIIDGGTGDDTLEAGNGIDTLNGGDGIDRLYGQNDNDILNGDVGDDFLDGGDGADKLFGGAGNDELLGQAGNDVLYGNAGDDAIDGGAGKDYLEGNDGNDTLFGGADIDTLYGNDGDDTLNGDAGNDTLFGGAGNDRINGGGDVDMVSYLTSPSGVVVNLDEGEYYGNDRQANANDAINPDNPAAYYTDLEVDFAINPGSAADGFGNTDTLINLENITGSQFADVLIGNDRNNTIFGLGGDDLLVGGGGNDQFHGGNGIDTVSYRRSWGSVDVNLEYNQANGADGYDRIFDTENIVGSNFNDILTGNAQANIITAGDGNDSVFGGAGNDILYGETGDDQVSGGIGNDTLYGNLGDDALNGDVGDDLGYGGAGDDLLNGGEGSDRLWGDQGDDALNGGTGDDFLDGGIGNDTLYGNEGNDQLFGQAGDDILDGGTGVDILSGGDGNDQLYGQAGDDTLDGGLGNDRLFGGDDNDTLDGQAGDDLLDGGTGSDRLSGGEGNDQLFGQAGDDILDGGLGDDQIDGGLGNDALSGGDGDDQLFGQAGDDLLDGGLGDDLLDGGVGNDGLLGGEGNDQLFGQAGDDTLNGGLGDDILKGGEGSDILSGGGGHDLFHINRGEGADTIADFTGVGRGTNPAPYLVPEIDTIVFSGADLFAENMLLSQVGGNLVISFEDINNTGVTLQNFALQNLDNHHFDTGASLTVGNILFEWDTDIQDSFDVINAEVNPTQVLRPNFVTFLNDLANKTSGFDHSDDVINGQGGNDTLRGLGGNDILRGGDGNDILIGGTGQDYLAGQSGNDYLEGGLDDDYLRGGDGNDFLSGGFGNDRIEGGRGNDQMFGGGGRDRFVIYRGDGADAIADFDGVGPGYAPYGDIISEADILQFIGSGLIAQNMILTQTDYEPLTGSSLVITFEGITDTSITLNNFSLENLDNLSTLGSNGSPLGNVLFQFDGDDIIKDSFDIFNSDWVLNQVLNANSVTFLNDLDNEISGFDWSDDIINGQGGNDILLGLGGNDILRGGLGNDVLLGGSGTNTLTGNAGFDTFAMSLGGSSLINDFTLGEDFIGLSDGITFEQLKIEQGTGVNAGSTSIKLLGDESILMSLKGVQANALNTTVFLPASSIFQSSSV